MEWTPIVKLIHLVTMLLMAAPFYSLIVINERALFSSTMVYKVDRYMETMIKKQALRCYIFQATILATGLILALRSGLSFSGIFTNAVLLTKGAFLFLLIALLSVVHFDIQPKIERLLGQVSDDPIPPEVASQIRSLRRNRKRIAATCLFLVLATIIMAVQLGGWFHPLANVVLLVLAALFSWRVYKVPVRFGWV